MKVLTYEFSTGMGLIRNPEALDFLSAAELKEMDNIGYIGKDFSGKKMNYNDYLNSLGKGFFKVECIHHNGSEFYDEYLVVRLLLENGYDNLGRVDPCIDAVTYRLYSYHESTEDSRLVHIGDVWERAKEFSKMGYNVAVIRSISELWEYVLMYTKHPTFFQL